MKRLLAVVLIIGASSGFIATRAIGSPPVTCLSTVSEFTQTFPRVYREAGAPEIHCIIEEGFGGGSYDGMLEPGTIDLNRVLSPTAIAAGYEGSMAAYWRGNLTHEMGHAWANRNGLDTRWSEYRELRRFDPADHPDEPAWPQEDYGETFSRWLGWGPAMYVPDAPYSFRTSAGPPDRGDFRRLRAAGMLPPRS